LTWKQHLFSKRVRQPSGRVDGFHILTDETKGDAQFTDRILYRKGGTEAGHAAFIVDGGNRLYIGIAGQVPDVLGKDCPYAYELNDKDRAITFVHGYFAPKGTPIPDIDELLKKQPKHLEEILRRANGGEAPVIAESVHFDTSRSIGTDWNRMASEFEKGKRPNEGATFTKDGKLFRMLDKFALEHSVDKSNSSGRQAGVQKKTLAPNGLPRQGFLKVLTVALVVVISGIAAWRLIKHWREKNQRKEQANPQIGR
jgi:hypothetical protein